MTENNVKKNHAYVENCPICGENKLAVYGSIMSISFAVPSRANRLRKLKKCSYCGSIAVEPLPSEEILQEYYEQYALRMSQCKNQNIWANRNILQTINGLARKMGRGKVLDIGCGDGSLLETLPASFEKFGVDSSVTASVLSSQKGIKTLCAPFLSISFNHRFDMITAIDVMEHFSEPWKAVKLMSELLVPGGYLVLQTGNADSSPAKILQENWSYTAIFGHLYALTPKAIRIMLAEKNVEEVSVEMTWHMRESWIKVLYHNTMAYGFHVYRRIYNRLMPIADRINILRNLYWHSPPEALRCDHFVYIGRRTK